MKSTESAPAAASTHTYAAPTRNPFIIVSDRSSRLTLIVQNRGAAVIIALLTGVGFGLFVDEVGKFITQKNDYFFPLAAPLVYASLLLILLFTELARRHQLRSPRAHLLAAITLSQTIADGTATPTEISAMEDHIRQARTGSLDDASAALLNGIETSMVLADRVEESFAFIGRTVRRIHRAVASWLPANRTRRFVRLAMAAFCILGLFQFLLLVGVAITPERLRSSLTLSVRDQPVGDLGKIVFLITWGLNAVVAALAGITWWALRPGRIRRRLALRCGYGAMLLMLLLGNLLSSYVYQFAILIQVALQVITLGLLVRWDQVIRPTTVA